jgi:hypothetical protein
MPLQFAGVISAFVPAVTPIAFACSPQWPEPLWGELDGLHPLIDHKNDWCLSKNLPTFAVSMAFCLTKFKMLTPKASVSTETIAPPQGGISVSYTIEQVRLLSTSSTTQD